MPTTKFMTKAQWAAANPMLAREQMGVETDTGKRKIGDGVSSWSALNYQPFPEAVIDGGEP